LKIGGEKTSEKKIRKNFRKKIFEKIDTAGQQFSNSSKTDNRPPHQQQPIEIKQQHQDVQWSSKK